MVRRPARFPARRGASPNPPPQVDVGTWLEQMESRQTFKLFSWGEKVDTTGHTFAKGKWDGDFTKEDYDKAKAKGMLGSQKAPSKKKAGFKLF